MTYKQARSDLKGILCPNCKEACDNCCVTTAVEALEKQIPQKPIKKTIKDAITYTEYYCPTCNEWLSLRLKNHHCKCGQALKWDTDKELVYCKDCKHYEHFDEKGGCCYYFGAMMSDDDFCSTGELR